MKKLIQILVVVSAIGMLAVACEPVEVDEEALEQEMEMDQGME